MKLRNNFTVSETAAILAEHYPWASRASQAHLEDMALAVHFGVGQVIRALRIAQELKGEHHG